MESSSWVWQRQREMPSAYQGQSCTLENVNKPLFRRCVMYRFIRLAAIFVETWLGLHKDVVDFPVLRAWSSLKPIALP